MSAVNLATRTLGGAFCHTLWRGRSSNSNDIGAALELSKTKRCGEHPVFYVVGHRLRVTGFYFPIQALSICLN